jgi:hypothetical protein
LWSWRDVLTKIPISQISKKKKVVKTWSIFLQGKWYLEKTTSMRARQKQSITLTDSPHIQVMSVYNRVHQWSKCLQQLKTWNRGT